MMKDRARRRWLSPRSLDGGASVLAALAGLMDEFDPHFNIVTL